MKKTSAIAVIGLAGFLGVAACGARVQVTPVPPAAPVNSASLAWQIATITVGRGGLTALTDGDGQAILAYCDPSTVSKPPHASTPTSVSCRIGYSDGSVWKQTVSVTFGSHGSAITGWANRGTQIVQPRAGDGPITRIRCSVVCPD
jgi:hypothetical protein